MTTATTGRNREEAARAAEADHFNDVGLCQQQVRFWFDAPSVGDVDHDGLPDAEDGWKSEPLAARIPATDRQPPRGTPATFAGGSRDAWHRAMNLGNGLVRSTDYLDGRYTPGRVGTGTIAQVERALGVTYVGSSTTMSGLTIPVPPKAPTRITEVRKLLQVARTVAKDAGNTRRVNRISKALEALPWR